MRILIPTLVLAALCVAHFGIAEAGGGPSIQRGNSCGCGNYTLLVNGNSSRAYKVSLSLDANPDPSNQFPQSRTKLLPAGGTVNCGCDCLVGAGGGSPKTRFSWTITGYD